MNNATVTLVVTTTTTDEYGDSTSTTTETPLTWALVAPRSSDEHADTNTPAVVTAATLYGPYGEAPAFVDEVIVADHSAAFDGRWTIEGLVGPWALDSWRPGFECALKRWANA